MEGFYGVDIVLMHWLASDVSRRTEGQLLWPLTAKKMRVKAKFTYALVVIE